MASGDAPLAEEVGSNSASPAVTLDGPAAQPAAALDPQALASSFESDEFADEEDALDNILVELADDLASLTV